RSDGAGQRRGAAQIHNQQSNERGDKMTADGVAPVLLLVSPILLRSTSRMEPRRVEMRSQWRTPPCSRSQLRLRRSREDGKELRSDQHPGLIPVSRSWLASAPAKRIRVGSLMKAR